MFNSKARKKYTENKGIAAETTNGQISKNFHTNLHSELPDIYRTWTAPGRIYKCGRNAPNDHICNTIHAPVRFQVLNVYVHPVSDWTLRSQTSRLKRPPSRSSLWQDPPRDPKLSAVDQRSSANPTWPYFIQRRGILLSLLVSLRAREAHQGLQKVQNLKTIKRTVGTVKISSKTHQSTLSGL